MKRAGICAAILVLALASAMTPVDAQEKYTVGYGAGT